MAKCKVIGVLALMQVTTPLAAGGSMYCYYISRYGPGGGRRRRLRGRLSLHMTKMNINTARTLVAPYSKCAAWRPSRCSGMSGLSITLHQGTADTAERSG